MFQQIEALFLLKIALLRNSWRKGQMLSGIFMTIYLLFAVILSFGLGILFFFLAWNLRSKNISTANLLLFADAFVAVYLFMVLAGFLSELQVSEVIDFKKMLYLPVSLKMVFLMNVAVSLITPSTFFFLMSSLGAVFGLSLGIGFRLLPGAILIAAFLWMIGAWMYFMKSWLSALLENKRRRRTVAAIAGLLVILLCQMPNLLCNVLPFMGRHHAARTEQTSKSRAFPYCVPSDKTLMRLNSAVPFGWLPLGICSLTSRNYGTASCALLGMGMLGLLGFSLGYKTTLRSYRGVSAVRKNEIPASPTEKNGYSNIPLTFRQIPWLKDDTSAVATVSFLTLLRHPNLRVQMAATFLIMVFASVPFLRSYGMGAASPESQFVQYISALAAVALPFMGASILFYNAFGVDLAGFKAYVLSPVDRSKILLGKNISAIPLVGTLSMLFLLVPAFVLHIGAIPLLMALLALSQIFLVVAMIGNITSIILPYAMPYEVVKGRKAISNRQFLSGMAVLATTGTVLLPIAVCHFSPLILSMTLSPSAGFAGAILSAALTAILLAAYRFSLAPSGKLLQKNEMEIVKKLDRSS